ncbi:MAG: class I SAM-dependent methyltransferase [Myxococcota bacterium]
MARYQSIVDPLYRSGHYRPHSTDGVDAPFKVGVAHDLLRHADDVLSDPIEMVADIGCGSGEITKLLPDLFASLGIDDVRVVGFDIHPGTSSLKADGVEFVAGDFCSEAKKTYDLITLFDIVEHVPDSIEFLKAVAEHARWLVLHLPLDDSWLVGVRDLAREKIADLGHLLQLDTASALNLLALAGLRVVDYRHSPIFHAPSGKRTRSQRILRPLRRVMFRVSPFVLQKTLGGVSLMVLARSPRVK